MQNFEFIIKTQCWDVENRTEEFLNEKTGWKLSYTSTNTSQEHFMRVSKDGFSFDFGDINIERSSPRNATKIIRYKISKYSGLRRYYSNINRVPAQFIESRRSLINFELEKRFLDGYEALTEFLYYLAKVPPENITIIDEIYRPFGKLIFTHGLYDHTPREQSYCDTINFLDAIVPYLMPLTSPSLDELRAYANWNDSNINGTYFYKYKGWEGYQTIVLKSFFDEIRPIIIEELINSLSSSYRQDEILKFAEQLKAQLVYDETLTFQDAYSRFEKFMSGIL